MYCKINPAFQREMWEDKKGQEDVFCKNITMRRKAVVNGIWLALDGSKYSIVQCPGTGRITNNCSSSDQT